MTTNTTPKQRTAEAVESRFLNNRHVLLARLNRTVDELNHLAGGNAPHPSMWAFDKPEVARGRDALVTATASDAISYCRALADALDRAYPLEGKPDAQ